MAKHNRNRGQGRLGTALANGFVAKSASGMQLTLARRFPRRYCGATVVGALALWLVCGSLAKAQRMDSFEGGEPRWLLVESDCQAQLTDHQISLLMPHGGRTCEMFEIACKHGQLALVAYPIEPCAVIDEFQPQLWTRCSSGRIQLGVRVIFPFARHPVTGGRLNTILWGDLYTDTGQWQMLQVSEIERRLREEIVALRQRFGSDLQLDGEYIDCLVVNAYTGPGRYRVQLDDLDLRGMIPMAATGNPPPSNWREKWRWRYEMPVPEERAWSAPNRPPVWLHYQGESLPWVESLGFSGLVLDQLPSEKQLQRIQDAELSVICPPPPYSLVVDQAVLPVIKGWLVGSALDARQADVARRQAARVDTLPSGLRRPLVGEALGHFWLFGRIADEVIVPSPDPVAAGGFGDKLSWLSQNLTTVRRRGQGWVSINVGPNPAITEQLRAAERVMMEQSATPRDIPANPLGLRHEVTSAVVAGAKGFLFRTFKPLNIQEAGERVQIAALRWINNDLTLWGPWIVGGQSMRPPTLSRPDYVAAAWSASQSQLIIAQTSADTSHYCQPSTAGSPLALELVQAAGADQVVRLTAGRVERMEVERTAAGILWQVERPAPIETFVIPSNPKVMDFVRRRLRESAIQNAADQLEIVSYNTGHAARLVAARFSEGNGRGSEAETEQLRQLARIQRELEQGWLALRASEGTRASALAYAASDRVQAILSEAQQVATSNLATPQSSPFVVIPAGLSFHWQLAEACQRSQWRDLNLPGGQLVDLQDMLQAGWSQQRRLEERVDLRVELVGPREGHGPGLRLAAYRKPSEELPGGYEGASLRVRSAAANVRACQLVRISATARVLRASEDPASGLLVYDNQAGPSLGQLVTGAVGQSVAVELYRFVVNEGELRVLAECRGECDIILESLRVSVIEPATNRRSYVTTPVTPVPADRVIISDEP